MRSQVGLRVHAVLLNHMQQFTFSASGALRWKADVGEYASVMGAFQQPPLADKLESLRVRACLDTLLAAVWDLLCLHLCTAAVRLCGLLGVAYHE